MYLEFTVFMLHHLELRREGLNSDGPKSESNWMAYFPLSVDFSFTQHKFSAFHCFFFGVLAISKYRLSILNPKKNEVCNASKF